jgi:hypothetical protein
MTSYNIKSHHLSFQWKESVEASGEIVEQQAEFTKLLKNLYNSNAFTP